MFIHIIFIWLLYLGNYLMQDIYNFLEYQEKGFISVLPIKILSIKNHDS